MRTHRDAHQAAPDWRSSAGSDIAWSVLAFAMAGLLKWWGTDAMHFWKARDYSLPMVGVMVGILFAGRIFGSYARHGRQWIGAFAYVILSGCGFLSGLTYDYLVAHLPFSGILAAIVGGGMLGVPFGFAVAGITRLYGVQTSDRATTKGDQSGSSELSDTTTNPHNRDPGAR